MEAVATWQEAHPSHWHALEWERAPYYLGLLATSRTTGNEKWADAVRKIGRDQGWKLGKRPFVADDHAVGQAWLALYEQDKLPEQRASVEAGIAAFAARPLAPSLAFVPNSDDEWWWCDSLFMGPQVLAGMTTASGDRAWLAKMDTRYWQTANYLFDPKNNLFFRDNRYFNKPEPNGAKLFWSRGNGWVFAGLVHILEQMPKDHPTRPKYEALFRNLAKRLIELQQDDGTWHASLLDPKDFPVPESSGTAFFCYGLLWGVNQGLLERSAALPPALKAWQCLETHVHPDGMLGFVQPVGMDPQNVNANMTDVYGSGAFLLAGSELHNLILLDSARRAKFSAKNTTKLNRLNEVASLPWSTVTKLLPKPAADHISVRDAQTGQFVPVQVLARDGHGTPDELLFLATVLPGQERSYEVVETNTPAPARPSRLQAARTAAQTLAEPLLINTTKH
jgi:rhamnogalacturonyl hydrolase YesR